MNSKKIKTNFVFEQYPLFNHPDLKLFEKKVSICMITYGHEDFIKQAIESVLIQEVDFLIELVIVNDCSPDNTDQIIQNIIKTNTKGDLIKYYNHTENLGMLLNFAFALNACKGKYIAICEGDDYWTDKLKLKKQVYFLDHNENYILIGHNAGVNYGNIEENRLVRNYNSKYKDFSSAALIQCNPFITSMSIFRNMGFDNIIDVLRNFNVGDWPLITLLSFYGKCRFFSEQVGYYRIHSNSVTSKNRTDYLQYKNEFVNRINHAEFWNNYSGKKYDIEEILVKKNRSRTLVNIALKKGDFKTAIYYSQYLDIKELDKFVSKLIAAFLKMIFKILKLILPNYSFLV